jgi:gamma-glutamyltranspeptidase / glutathione hydrolase
VRAIRFLSANFALVVVLAPGAAGALPAAGARGLVTSAHPEATRAGVEMLRQGGNAVDAAVATAFALAVVEPYSSGIGGGGFALVHFGTSLSFIDFREVAPAAASREMFIKDGKPDPILSRDGPLAVAVPGAVAGYLDLLARFGKLPRDAVLAPAIKLAEAGIVVDPSWRAYITWRLDVLEADPEAARLFLVNGELPPLGHRVVQKDLGRTLRALAKEGARAFYQGSIAKKLAADMQRRGGVITLADLAAYRVRDRAPLVGSFRGLAVASSPPPSAGGQVVLTLLNALETLPTGAKRNDPAGLHLYIEVAKRAFADRHLLGDPSFVAAPVAALITKERVRALLGQLAERATPASAVSPGDGALLPAGMVIPKVVARPSGDDTTHLCTIDAAGNAVALTTTVNYGWGAGIVAAGTGVVWNDQMDDFAVAPGVPNAYGIVGAEANAIAPGKVPLSSMSPTMVFAGAGVDAPVRLVVGSPGGPRIPTTVVQAIVNHVVHGADIEQAITLGRIHHQHLPDVVSIEPFAVDPATRSALEARGHTFKEEPRWSNANAIAVDPVSGVRSGAADARGVGAALAE